MKLKTPAQWATQIREQLSSLSDQISTGDPNEDARISGIISIPLVDKKIFLTEMKRAHAEYQALISSGIIESRIHGPQLALIISRAYGYLAEMADRNERLHEAWNFIAYSLFWKENTVRGLAARRAVAIHIKGHARAHSAAIDVALELKKSTASDHGTMMAHASHAEDDELKAYLRVWFRENHTKYELDGAIKAGGKLIPSKPDTIRKWIIQFRKELGLSKPRKKKPRI